MCAYACAMAARLRAAGLEDPRVLEAAAFENAGELVKFLYGDSVPNDAELQEIGVYMTTARAKAGLARRATLAGASERLPRFPRQRLGRRPCVNVGPRVASKTPLEKWSQRFATILQTAQVPSWDVAQEAEDPSASIMGMVGKARPATIKKRVRTWELFSRWLMWRRGRAWPSSSVDLVDYIHETVAEGCFASFPEVFRAAVSWMEARSGLPEGQRFSQDDFFKKNVDRALVVAVRGTESVKKAPRFPLSVVAAMEVQVNGLGASRRRQDRHLDAVAEGLRRPPQ